MVSIRAPRKLQKFPVPLLASHTVKQRVSEEASAPNEGPPLTPSADALLSGASGHGGGDLERVLLLPDTVVLDREDGKVLLGDIVDVVHVGDTESATREQGAVDVVGSGVSRVVGTCI